MPTFHSFQDIPKLINNYSKHPTIHKLQNLYHLVQEFPNLIWPQVLKLIYPNFILKYREKYNYKIK